MTRAKVRPSAPFLNVPARYGFTIHWYVAPAASPALATNRVLASRCLSAEAEGEAAERSAAGDALVVLPLGGVAGIAARRRARQQGAGQQQRCQGSAERYGTGHGGAS